MYTLYINIHIHTYCRLFLKYTYKKNVNGDDGFNSLKKNVYKRNYWKFTLRY
jgi:hypothetical protein